MNIDNQQIDATIERYNKRTRQRNRNERLIDQKNYLEIDTPARVEKFLERRGLNRQEAAEMLSDQMPVSAPEQGPPEGEGVPNPLERILGTNDLMGVAFLEQGLQVARTVGRIWVAVAGGRPLGYGTGFMISPRLLLTNNHVLGSKPTARKSLVEFNYQLGLDGKTLQSASFDLDPDTFFITDGHLDYTVVAVRQSAVGGRDLAAFGWNPLIEEEGKAIISQWLNIIQHPNGEVKQLCLRENRLVDVFDEFLHYRADTAPGSSGSPVFNDRWEVVGLHHSGVWKTNLAGQILAVDGRVWDESMGEHRINWKADAVEAAGEKASFNKLTLVMQRGESVGEGTKADDLTDDQVVEQLGGALGGKFENAWVKIGPVNGWVASSYHIKVAVRDQKAFWLSSGNWQSSNQPNGDPLGEEPPRRLWLDKYNREWHAVVENSGLSKLFEAYLLHDFQNNLGAGEVESLGFESLDLPDLLIPEEFFMPSAAERTGQLRYFQPFDDNRAFIVTPLLTPDNYHDETLKLVESAEEELLIQNQTFNAPKQDQARLRELIDAVIAKQQAGVRVRVIFRILFPAKARQVIEELKDYGFDVDSLKVQKNCHTKGIVVDRKKVMLGSQNWSGDGVSVNRDASLLFEDAPLAKYFAKIFDHDWNNIARQNIGPERLPIERVAADEKTPSGFVRLNWKDYLEML